MLVFVAEGRMVAQTESCKKLRTVDSVAAS